MRRALSGICFIAGVALMSGTVALKENLPMTLGRSTPLIWSMGAVAFALFGIGLALSAYNLLRRRFPISSALYFLCNLFAVVVYASLIFLANLVLSRFMAFTSVQESRDKLSCPNSLSQRRQRYPS